jgi:hypothetical protein
MKRLLVAALATATSVGVAVPAVSGAAGKPLKVTSNGWYVFDEKPPTTKTPKNGTNTRCVNDPNTPPVKSLGARFGIANKSLPKGSKYILNGPSKLHIVHATGAAVSPGAYFYKFKSSKAGRSSFSPGKYTFLLKVGKTTKTTEFIKLVDNPNC